MGLLQWLFWMLLAVGFMLYALGHPRAAADVFMWAVGEWFVYGIAGALMVLYRFAKGVQSRAALQRQKGGVSDVSKT